MARQNSREHKVENYRLSLLDDGSHRQIWSVGFNKMALTISIITLCCVLVALFYSLFSFTPLRTTIPGYPDATTKRNAVQNAIKIDSLENIINRWELYTENLSRVVDGLPPIDIDSVLRINSSNGLEDVDALELAASDSLLRLAVTNSERTKDSGGEKKNLPLEGIHFFTPLKGVVSGTYQPVIHPYLDITAPAGTIVMSILDGTVLFAGWTDESGYVIQIQHSGGLVSVYTHNQKLLKTQGDRVSAGSPIALVGNTGLLTTEDHLHFELWCDGEALNPLQYISF